MCLIAFSWLNHPRWRLVLAANRDEYYDRPTAPAHWWTQQESLAQSVYGGRDLKAGGTWMALMRSGQFAAVTNIRSDTVETSSLSRGAWVLQALATKPSAALQTLQSYGPCNGLVGNLRSDALYWMSNRAALADTGLFKQPQAISQILTPGIHSLSNAALNSEWPKGLALKNAIAQSLKFNDAQTIINDLLKALTNEDRAPDLLLPNSGVDLALERVLSSAFIRSQRYGTRSSTVILVDTQDQVCVQERSFVPALANTELKFLDTYAQFNLAD
jgi:uncharacterized protein with NRDE domain